VQRGRGVPRDLDNFAKPLMDRCQSRLAVHNDRDFQDRHLRWGSPEAAPAGVRIMLTAVSPA